MQILGNKEITLVVVVIRLLYAFSREGWPIKCIHSPKLHVCYNGITLYVTNLLCVVQSYISNAFLTCACVVYRSCGQF